MEAGLKHLHPLIPAVIPSIHPHLHLRASILMLQLWLYHFVEGEMCVDFCFFLSTDDPGRFPIICYQVSVKGTETLRFSAIFHISESWSPCVNARVISDAGGPPTYPAESVRDGGRAAAAAHPAWLLSHWHGHRRRTLTIQEQCLPSSVAKGNLPLSAFCFDAHFLRWEDLLKSSTESRGEM